MCSCCLPDFCQPYRIVCNAGIADYFEGRREERRVGRWLDVLGNYRRRWARWLEGKVPGMGPGLVATVGSRFGRPPPPGPGFAGKFWRQLVRACGGIASATDRGGRGWRRFCARRDAPSSGPRRQPAA